MWTEEEVGHSVCVIVAVWDGWLNSQEQSQEQCMSNKKKINYQNSSCKSTEVDICRVWPTSLGNTFPFPFRSTCWTGVSCNGGKMYINNTSDTILSEIYREIQMNLRESCFFTDTYRMGWMKCHYYYLVNVLHHIFQRHLKNECE